MCYFSSLDCVFLAHSLVFSDEQHGRLFITFNTELTVLELKPEIKDYVVSHDAAVVGAFYSCMYNQVSNY